MFEFSNTTLMEILLKNAGRTPRGTPELTLETIPGVFMLYFQWDGMDELMAFFLEKYGQESQINSCRNF